MEKTNNNIPSAEELAIYIKEATVSVKIGRAHV